MQAVIEAGIEEVLLRQALLDVFSSYSSAAYSRVEDISI